MKSITLFSIVFITALLSGALLAFSSAGYYSRSVLAEALKNTAWQHNYSTEYLLRSTLENIEDTQEGKADLILSRACNQLQTFSEFVKIDVTQVDPVSTSEVLNLKERAKAKLYELKSLGHCEIE